MTTTIAVAGKGGTGKTTFAALVIKYLKETTGQPILAIDGDPSSNLNLSLGLKLDETIGDIREDTLGQVKGGTFQQGISKPDYLEYRINECLVESEGVDLLAMGRPEGPGCYCAANNILRTCIDRLGNDYEYVVIDNEAGMEHVSRQTTRDLDLLFVISDPTFRGLAAAEHIAHLLEQLGTRVDKAYLVLNRVGGAIAEPLEKRVSALGIPLIGTLPVDPLVNEYDMIGRPIIELGDDSAIYSGIRDILERTLPK